MIKTIQKVSSSFDNGCEVFSDNEAEDVNELIKSWLEVNQDYEIVSHNLQAWTEQAHSWHKNHVIVTIQWRRIENSKEQAS